MAVIKCKLKLDASKVKRIEDAKAEALHKTIEALHADVVNSQVLPFDVGTLQDNTFATVSKEGKEAALITRTPYALRLYYHPEYNFQTKNNRNAQGLWLETYLTGDKKDFCRDKFAYFFKKAK